MVCWNAFELITLHQPFAHKSRNIIRCASIAFERTLPDHSNFPARLLKGLNVPTISGDVFIELLMPVILVGSRYCSRFATMSVPETTMHEQNRLEPREDDVRRTWQSFVVKPIAQSNFVQRPSKLHLRTGVFLTDPGHDSRTCRFVHGIQCGSYPVDNSFQLVELFAFLQELRICLLRPPNKRVVMDDSATWRNRRHG